MGTEMEVSFANIFKAKIETTLIQQNEEKAKRIETVYWRYLLPLEQEKKWINLLNKLTNSTLPSNARPKYQRTRLLSSTQWCSKEKD